MSQERPLADRAAWLLETMASIGIGHLRTARSADSTRPASEPTPRRRPPMSPPS